MHFGGRSRLPGRATLALLVLSCVTASAAPRQDVQGVNADLVGGVQIPSDAGSVLLVWGGDATILRSENGQDWLRASTPGSADITHLAANAKGDVLVAVGAAGAILRSTDAGRTWRAAKNKTLDTDLAAVASAGERTWIAAGTAGRVLRSTDDGRTWSSIDSQLNVALRALSFDAVSGRVFVGGDDGLVGFSADRGESWQVTLISMPDPATPIGAFHRFGKLLLATSTLGRFLTSDDDGAGWDLLQSSSRASFTDAAWDPDHGVIVVTGHNGDVLRSKDGGRNWEGGEVVFEGRKNCLGSIRHDPLGHALLVTAQAGTLARSVDGGETWASATRDLRGEIRGLMPDSDPGRLHRVWRGRAAGPLDGFRGALDLRARTTGFAGGRRSLPDRPQRMSVASRARRLAANYLTTMAFIGLSWWVVSDLSGFHRDMLQGFWQLDLFGIDVLLTIRGLFLLLIALYAVVLIPYYLRYPWLHSKAFLFLQGLVFSGRRIFRPASRARLAQLGNDRWRLPLKAGPLRRPGRQGSRCCSSSFSRRS